MLNSIVLCKLNQSVFTWAERQVKDLRLSGMVSKLLFSGQDWAHKFGLFKLVTLYRCVRFQAYPSLKPLASWVTDLVARVQFIDKWIEHGIPPVSHIP